MAQAPASNFLQPRDATVIGDNVVMVYSDHIANPINYGLLSVLTLNLYPNRFGDDLMPRATGNERWPQSMTGILKAEAKKTFAASRTIFIGCLVMIVATAVLRRMRRRVSAKAANEASE